jgi:hypothetical protein
MPRSGASQALQLSGGPAFLFAVGSMSHAGGTLPHRTATTVGLRGQGSVNRQGVILVVAARPSASRCPVAARNAIHESPGEFRTRMGSGTLRLVKCKCNWQSNTEVSRPSHLSAWLGRERKGGGSKAAPNPFIEGTVKGLRPSPAPHVER